MKKIVLLYVILAAIINVAIHEMIDSIVNSTLLQYSLGLLTSIIIVLLLRYYLRLRLGKRDG